MKYPRTTKDGMRWRMVRGKWVSELADFLVARGVEVKHGKRK